MKIDSVTPFELGVGILSLLGDSSFYAFLFIIGQHIQSLWNHFNLWNLETCLAQARRLSFHDSTRLFLINTVANFKESRRWGKGMIEGNFANKNLFSKQKCVFGGGGGRWDRNW